MRNETPSCPICRSEVRYEERYPNKLCDSCAEKAVDCDGRGVTFFNVSFSGGLAAEDTDTGEPYQSNTCYVDRQRCQADEHRFGGIVLQPLLDAD